MQQKQQMVQFTPSNSSKWYGSGSQGGQSTASDMTQQQPDSGSFTFKQQQQQQQQATAALRHQSSSTAANSADGHLFQTPSDLVCPITLSLFQDPVCNALGQVYERAALQRHLLQAAVSGQAPTDPVSNAVLPSLDLVPVWPMRSRAAEYRDSTIRACVQSAAAPDCSDPVRYLRRAAELVLSSDPALTSRLSSSSSGSHTPTAASAAAGSPPSTRPAPFSSSAAQPGADTSASDAAPGAADSGSTTGKAAAMSPAGATTAGPLADVSAGAAGTGVPGLTVEFAQYLAAHQGSQYDALVLKYFGNELLRAGCPDAASNVFYRLLLEAEDKVQQAEYLQLCLDCWTISSAGSSGDDSTDSTRSVAAGVEAGGQHNSKGAQIAAGAASATIISKLADFVQRQRCLSPRAIVQMLESTHHGAAMAMQLCQVLLTRAAAAAAAAGPAGNAEAVLGLPGGLGGVLEVLLELVELGHGQLIQQVQQLIQQVQQLQAVHSQQQQGDAIVSAAQAAGAGAGQDGAAGAGVVQQGGCAGSKAAVAGAKAHSRRSRGHRWKGGKGMDVLLGRVARVAAAGTLAVASLASGNHPVLRLARVGPLLYLLRSGL